MTRGAVISLLESASRQRILERFLVSSSILLVLVSVDVRRDKFIFREDVVVVLAWSTTEIVSRVLIVHSF